MLVDHQHSRTSKRYVVKIARRRGRREAIRPKRTLFEDLLSSTVHRTDKLLGHHGLEACAAGYEAGAEVVRQPSGLSSTGCARSRKPTENKLYGQYRRCTYASCSKRNETVWLKGLV